MTNTPNMPRPRQQAPEMGVFNLPERNVDDFRSPGTAALLESREEFASKLNFALGLLQKIDHAEASYSGLLLRESDKRYFLDIASDAKQAVRRVTEEIAEHMIDKSKYPFFSLGNNFYGVDAKPAPHGQPAYRFHLYGEDGSLPSYTILTQVSDYDEIFDQADYSHHRVLIEDAATVLGVDGFSK